MALAPTRADSLTQTLKKRAVYSDFVDSFIASPVNGELGRVTNEAAVKQSLYNLVMTNLGERPFQPHLGTDVNRLLFENGGPITDSVLVTNVTNTITQYEPRVELLGVEVVDDAVNNTLTLVIVFTMINSTVPQTLTVLLHTVR